MTTFSLSSALDLTRVLAGIAVLLQNLEMRSLRKSLARIGGSFTDRYFGGILAMQLFGVLCLIVLPDFHAPSAAVVFATSLLISVHFRGSFNGGADAMTLVILSALCVAFAFPSHPLATKAALVYIGLHSTLSYVIAGISKLKKSRWRSGAEIRDSLKDSSYAVPATLVRSFSEAPTAFAVSWTLMLFEIAVVPALMSPHTLSAWLVLALAFHLLNFAALGLNRFLFVWVATYPALIYLGETLRA
ncbi:MAG: HTTM domain-containing protein [Bdellovibrionota bacterium]